MEQPVNCFLSCSIRARDRVLVDAIDRQVLSPMGFACHTIGRNNSSPAQADDAVKRLVAKCDCLVGVATGRYTATDVDTPERTLQLATPYLVQETAAAHQVGLPFLIFRTEHVSLEGVARRNLYVEIRDHLSQSGKVQFACRRELLETSLKSLRLAALAFRDKRKTTAFWSGAKTLGLLAAGTVAAFKSVDVLGRPPCFGEFYYKNAECKQCERRQDCKAEKVRGAR